MTRELFMRLAGHIPFDSPDRLGDKAIEMPGDRMSLLWYPTFSRAWNTARKTLTKIAEDHKRPMLNQGGISAFMTTNIHKVLFLEKEYKT